MGKLITLGYLKMTLATNSMLLTYQKILMTPYSIMLLMFFIRQLLQILFHLLKNLLDITMPMLMELFMCWKLAGNMELKNLYMLLHHHAMEFLTNTQHPRMPGYGHNTHMHLQSTSGSNMHYSGINCTRFLLYL